MEKHSNPFKNNNSNNNSGIASCARSLCFVVSVGFLAYTAFSNLLTFKVGSFCSLYNKNCTADDNENGYHNTGSYQNEQQRLGKATAFGEQVNVLIFSLPRSGSSFLGEIFNREDDVMYLYEPLHAHDALQKLPIHHRGDGSSGGSEGRKRNNNAFSTLQNLFSCNVQQENNLFQFLSYPELSNPHFRLMSKVLSSPPFCDYALAQNSTELEYRKHCVYVNTTQLSSICGDKKSVVVKELLHRLPLYQPQMLKELFELRNLKSIWLVRDPRAIISSMMSMGWLEEKAGDEVYQNALSNAMRQSIHKVCNVYHRFLETLSTLVLGDSLRGSKLIIVRYEDLMTKPLSTVYQILKFAKINVRIDTLNWVLENINGRATTGNRPHDRFSISHRNSSYSLTAWRKILDFRHVLSIQKQCTHVMQRFGYVVFSNKSNIYDLNSPSTVESYDMKPVSNIEQLMMQW